MLYLFRCILYTDHSWWNLCGNLIHFQHLYKIYQVCVTNWATSVQFICCFSHYMQVIISVNCSQRGKNQWKQARTLPATNKVKGCQTHLNQISWCSSLAHAVPTIYITYDWGKEYCIVSWLPDDQIIFWGGRVKNIVQGYDLTESIFRANHFGQNKIDELVLKYFKNGLEIVVCQCWRCSLTINLLKRVLLHKLEVEFAIYKAENFGLYFSYTVFHTIHRSYDISELPSAWQKSMETSKDTLPKDLNPGPPAPRTRDHP